MLMTRYPKRLIEVDLPIKRISAHARREKSIRHGHISTLHIWWARRPLAACRAVICAALWPDPEDLVRFVSASSSAVNPLRFLDEARQRMHTWATRYAAKASADSLPRIVAVQKNPALLEDPTELRRMLLDFIADFANWDNSTDAAYLETARALTQAAHEALGGAPGTRPLVVDPFAGGGSIPLEALRVGADAFASDLNPIPVLLNKVVLEYIPKYGQRLADEVRKWGRWIKEQAEQELAAFYPKDPPTKELPGGATPIAYLWARTILSEAPGLPAGEAGEGDTPVEVPLMRSLWLAKKAGRRRALRWVRDEAGQIQTETVAVTYVVDGQPVVKRVRRPLLETFEPKKESEVEGGTVARGSATCPVSGYTTKVDSVRAQLKQRRGGAADARLFAVVTTRDHEQGRFYRLPTQADRAAFAAAAAELAARLKKEGGAGTQRSQVLTRHAGGTVQSGISTSGTLSIVPDEPTPLGGGRGAGRAFSQRNYGMDFFADLFSPRQLLALTTLARLVREAGIQISDEPKRLAEAVQAVLALALSRFTDIFNSLCVWENSKNQVRHLFGRQAISMIWDFAEGGPFAQAAGDFSVTLGTMIEVIARLAVAKSPAGHIELVSAASHPLPNDAAAAFFTDPPYYDSVPYSDLSDFFYVWLKRTLPTALLPAFTETLTPKDAECIVDDAKGKDSAFYEMTMREAMAEGRRIAQPSGVGVVVFAHKSTAGWESQLAAMIEAGWIITGSWPIDTEMGTRLRAMGSAALASSVHIVMRPREEVLPQRTQRDAEEQSNKPSSLRTPAPSAVSLIGDWRDLLTELPTRIHAWLPRLAAEGVVGADAIFACLGPALEVFSRYSRVEKASGEQVTLREYLEQVWAAVSKEALNMIFAGGDATGFEEDARLTAMWLWTIAAGIKGSSDQGIQGEEAEAAEDEEEEGGGRGKKAAGAVPAGRQGYVLEYDAARKIAQGLGAHLEKLTNVVEVKGDTARLLSVAERTKALFGKEQAEAPAARRKKKDKQMQLGFAAELEAAEAESGGWASPAGRQGEKSVSKAGDTVLDRVHQAMILFAAGRGEALRRFLVDDGVGGDQHFWRLAQALSALYPSATDEKRWVDGVLARKKGLGL